MLDRLATNSWELIRPSLEKRMRQRPDPGTRNTAGHPFQLVGITAIVAISVAVLSTLGVGTALAANPPGTGQPSRSCVTVDPMEPGQASSAPGSAFNENGGIAGSVYAGNGASSLNGNQDKAISQYDVACFQVSQSH